MRFLALIAPERVLHVAGLPLIGLAAAGTALTPADRFKLADVDASEELSPPEFAGIFRPALPQGQEKKEFRAADKDRDGGVTRLEWLNYLRDSVLNDPAASPDAKFEVVDCDFDGSLTLEEFALLIPGQKPLTEIRKRFLMADTNDNDLVTLDEWRAYREDPQPDTSGIPHRKFDLADLDEDGELTVLEFANAYPPAVKLKTIAKKFAGKDKNRDAYLTRDEWNPGAGSGAL